LSDSDTVILRIDPALRVAMEIARQEGIPQESVERMYTKTVLGEVPATAMLLQIKKRVGSDAAREQVQAVIDSLPHYIGNRTATEQPPIGNE